MLAGLIVFTFVWLVSYLIVNIKYSNVIRIGKAGKGSIKGSPSLHKKMTIWMIVAISLLCSLYNYYVTETSVVTGGDRLNYIANFTGIRKSPSAGLGLVIQLIHFFNGSVETLYYFTTFMCMFVTLLAYRNSKVAKPKDLLLLFLSQYVVTTFTALKQSYTSAFATLFFVLLLEGKGKRKDCICIILITLAILFHPTGFVLVPIYFVIKCHKNKKDIILFFFVMLPIGLFFEPLMLFLAEMIYPMVPSLAEKIISYLGESRERFPDSSMFAFVKGVPYYFITLLGLVKRDKLLYRIRNYDNYLICIGTASFLYIMSIYNQWLSRFIYLFSFVAFVFFGLIVDTVAYKANRIVFNFFVCGGVAAVTYRFLILVYAISGGF